MEDIIPYIVWAVIIISGVVSSIGNAKKKREEAEMKRKAEARAAADARAAAGYGGSSRVGGGSAGAGSGMGSGGGFGTGSGAGLGTGSGSGAGRETKPAGSSFGRMLEELARQLGDNEAPTAAPRPVVRPFALPSSPSAHTQPQSAKAQEARAASYPAATYTATTYTSAQPEATSFDYYSLEDEYNTMDYRGGEAGYEEDEIAAYERLAAQRARRSTLAQTRVTSSSTAGSTSASGGVSGSMASSGSSVAAYAAAGSAAAGSVAADRDGLAASTDATEDKTTLQELLGGNFDLRRAVIEAEILTPKYITH